jgi:hypothetical protein
MKTSASDEFVSRDSDLLALHMLDCRRARSRFFKLQSTLELMHAVVSPRIVTSFALVAVACGVSLLAFA